ncbi:hypothetical protein [Actinosynnema mirum]|uniref:hypothetical protein n=1 Tax=Actinosynnema mirum TaxID=40567 RepID=UPI00019AB693|nr:hypothetical protein [Actinosynnema mirum]
MHPLLKLLLTPLLLLVYAFVLTPVALVVRLFHDPLRRDPDPGATTYWSTPGVTSRRTGR